MRRRKKGGKLKNTALLPANGITRIFCAEISASNLLNYLIVDEEKRKYFVDRAFKKLSAS